MAYRDALGLPIEPVRSYRVGRRCVYLPNDLKGYRLAYNGSGSLLAWIRSWLGSEAAVFSWRDFLPAMEYLSEFKRHIQHRKAHVAATH